MTLAESVSFYFCDLSFEPFLFPRRPHPKHRRQARQRRLQWKRKHKGVESIWVCARGCDGVRVRAIGDPVLRTRKGVSSITCACGGRLDLVKTTRPA
jgi:hypothetical protein